MSRRFQNITSVVQPLPDQQLEPAGIAVYEDGVPHDVQTMVRNGTLIELEDEPAESTKSTEKPASRGKGGKN